MNSDETQALTYNGGRSYREEAICNVSGSLIPWRAGQAF